MTARAQPVLTEVAAYRNVLPRQLYYALLECPADDSNRHAAQHYLNEQLHSAAALESDLPADPEALTAWVQDNAASVGSEYRAYLQARREGAAVPVFLLPLTCAALPWLHCANEAGGWRVALRSGLSLGRSALPWAYSYLP